MQGGRASYTVCSDMACEFCSDYPQLQLVPCKALVGIEDTG